MRQKLFNFAAAVSLIVFVAQSLAWVETYPKVGFEFKHNGQMWEVALQRGVVSVSDLPQRMADGRQLQQLTAAYQRMWAAYQRMHIKDLERPLPGNAEAEAHALWVLRAAGAMPEYARLSARINAPPQGGQTSAGVVLAFAAIVPLCWGASRAFALRRQRLGHCVHCGYDLRATPERCPECGAIPSEANAVASEAAPD